MEDKIVVHAKHTCRDKKAIMRGIGSGLLVCGIILIVLVAITSIACAIACIIANKQMPNWFIAAVSNPVYILLFQLGIPAIFILGIVIDTLAETEGSRLVETSFSFRDGDVFWKFTRPDDVESKDICDDDFGVISEGGDDFCPDDEQTYRYSADGNVKINRRKRTVCFSDGEEDDETRVFNIPDKDEWAEFVGMLEMHGFCDSETDSELPDDNEFL